MFFVCSSVKLKKSKNSVYKFINDLLNEATKNDCDSLFPTNEPSRVEVEGIQIA